MTLPQPFALTPRLLAAHGFAGRALAVPATALGSMVQLLPTDDPGVSVPWALQGRRADCMVWAPLAPPRVKASRRDEDEDPDSDYDPDSDDEESSSYSAMADDSPVVRVVSVRGLLSSERRPWSCGTSDGYQGSGGIVDRTRQAAADPRAVAVVLDMMSPGGDALLCMESAAELAELAESTTKPILVYASEATSAAYALSVGAAKPGCFFVAPSADVGNVGTRTWHVDQSAANEKDGIKITHIGDPGGKVLGNPDEPLAPEALARIERDIKESTSRFVAFVSARRPGLSPEAVRALDADTRRGQAAVDAGLADGTAKSLSEVVALAFARAQSLAAPTVITTSAGMQADEDDDNMKLSPTALKALGLAPGATAASIEAAILRHPKGEVLTQEHDPLRALGAVTLEALGTTDAEAAMVEVPRRLAAASTAPSVKEERDDLRRERAWNEAITSGAFTAGEVWRQVEVNGKRSKAFTTMAAAFNAAYPDVAQLESRLAKLPKLARQTGDAAPDPAGAAAASADRAVSTTLTPKWVSLATRAGVDPAKLAARTAQNLGQENTQ